MWEGVSVHKGSDCFYMKTTSMCVLHPWPIKPDADSDSYFRGLTSIERLCGPLRVEKNSPTSLAHETFPLLDNAKNAMACNNRDCFFCCCCCPEKLNKVKQSFHLTVRICVHLCLEHT